MTEGKRDSLGTLHFHIGVDGVEKDLPPKLYEALATQDDAQRLLYVDEDEFKSRFRGPIAAGDADGVHRAIRDLFLPGASLLISRPRFLFSGIPLNFSEGVKKGIYKVSTLQEALADFQIEFHLFLEDHVAYLGRHLEAGNVSIPVDETPSWIPLIRGLRAAMQEGSHLSFWNAEHPGKLWQGFGTAIGLCPVATIGMQRLPDLTRYQHFEQCLAANGWSAQALDDAFAYDVEFLNQVQ